MKKYLWLVLMFALSSLVSCTTVNAESHGANCQEAAVIACMTMERSGLETRIEIQKTPWSDKGIYHAQCQVKVEGEWKYVILDKWPDAMIGHREYGEGVEYWTVEKAVEMRAKKNP